MRYLVVAAYLILALAVVVPFAGGTWIMLRLKQAQGTMKQKIDSGTHTETLIVLDISKEEENAGPGIFIRIHSREFIYHGQMYDVVSVSDFGLMKRYLVFPDFKETKLRRKLARKMEQTGTLPLKKTVERIGALCWLIQKPKINILNPFAGLHRFAPQKSCTLAGFRSVVVKPPDIPA